MLTVKSGT